MRLYRLLALALLVVFVAPMPALAYSKTQGWCEKGGVTVSVPGASGPSSSRYQQSYRGCTVTVYNTGTVVAATIYSDTSGTAKANPFTADSSTGYWSFYADNGRYDVRFSGGGISSPFTLGDFNVGGPTLNCNDFPGADAGAKINACITALPSTGGVADASLIQGTQSAAATISLNKPVRLVFGGPTLTMAGSPNIDISSDGASILCSNSAITTLVKGANATMLRVSSSYTSVENCNFNGASSSFTGIGINVTDGNYQRFSNIIIRLTEAAGIQIEATKGIGMSVIGAAILVAGNAIRVNGNDGSGAGTAAPRHFVAINTGGANIDFEGANIAILADSFTGEVLMNSSSNKLMFINNRMGTVAGITITGINHSVIGNVLGGPVTIAAAVTGATIGPNVSVGAMVNNATATDNIIIDHNSYSLFPKLAVGITGPNAGVGMFVRPATSTGTAQYGLQVAPQATSASTTEAAGLVVRSDTAAASFTVPNNYGIFVQDGVKGAGSTITTQYGIYIADQTVGGTNYGLYSAATGASAFVGPLSVTGLVTAAGSIDLQTVLFAALGAPINGRIVLCSDCSSANPCAGGGTGALAKRIGGAWVCN